MKLRHLIPATLLGLGLRIFFIAKFPYIAGDSDLYQELAQNLHDAHVYGLFWGDTLVSVDNRMPGYPAFLALVLWILGPGNERLMMVQAGIDVLGCLGIAWLAAKLNPRAAAIALWLAMLCPFTANFAATVLTEAVTTALVTLALLFLCNERAAGERAIAAPAAAAPATAERPSYLLWFAASVTIGVATMMRPESPLFLAAAGLALAWRRRRQVLSRAFWPEAAALTRVALTMALGLLLVLAPWGYRNWVQMGRFSMIANPDALLPWEHGLAGFDNWTRTWLVSSHDTYAVAFKFDEETIDINDLPARAFDSPEEKQHTAELLARYNETKSTPPTLNWDFELLARARAARNPWRQHVTIPLLRMVHYWFTPRIQALPFSGDWWPLRWAWENDPRDFSVTVTFFFLNIVYVVLGLWGAWRYRHTFPVALMMTFMVVRTLFLTEHGTIEPRYMLVCFPALLAMGAAGLVKVQTGQSEPSIHTG